MLGLFGVLILLALLWMARRSRARGLLNTAQQRLSGALAILIAALLLVRGDWGLGLGLGLFGFICSAKRFLGRSAHWPLILTAGVPAGVSTRKVTRIRGSARSRRLAAK